MSGASGKGIVATSLAFNCGFARVAVRELTDTKCGRPQSVDKEKRALEFKDLFEIPSFGLPSNYFSRRGLTREPLFDKHCKTIAGSFSMRWNTKGKTRQHYLKVFSTETWKSLPQQQKSQHSLSKCYACATLYKGVQEAFPLKPIYTVSPTLEEIYDATGTSKKQENTVTRKALEAINTHHVKKFGKTIIQSAIQACPEEKIQRKPTPLEKKQARRKVLRQVRDKENESLQHHSFSVVFSENESLSSYSRKRKATYLKTPQVPKKAKSHIPQLSQVSWDKQSVLRELQALPDGSKVNWSEIARTHGVPGGNAGQVVKEFARQNGVDVSALDSRPASHRVRSQKRKLPGGEISVPCPPTISVIKKQRNELISDGTLVLGQPCAPHSLTRWTIENGKLQEQVVQVYGRKIPLLILRERLLQQHEQFMRLTSDEQLQQSTREELLQMLNDLHKEIDPAVSTECLREKVREFQRNRSLLLWHDHGTVVGCGYIMITVSVLYDPAAFLGNEEYSAKTGRPIHNIQEQVEQPHIYMLAASSSSISDQLALIADRVDCLHDLPKKIKTSEGIEVTDHLVFFTGDQPAQSFERGSQVGGNYKCGSCGVHTTMIADLANTLHCKWRSLDDLQKLALAGNHGNKPGSSKPFDKLKVKELREELRARGSFDIDKPAPELRTQLAELLQGIQRVPSLVIHSPTATLASLNLGRYMVVDCEPLHALKGHLTNLFAELPHILTGDFKETCKTLIEKSLAKDKITGADLRRLAIHVLILFQNHGNDELITLMDTIVRVSSLLYSTDAKRCPRSILQLYNTTWLHHELCVKLFTSPREVSYQKFFGSYLHDLSAHAGQIYEIVCLRSVNAECQERLFGQAKQIALNTTNRKPNNVIPEILLRLQIKQMEGKLISALRAGQTKVSKAAKHVPAYPGTRVAKDFLKNRSSSWQTHLQRLSRYLVLGYGEWWREEEFDFMFHDSDSDLHFRESGPNLHHFRTTALQEVFQEQQKLWTTIVNRHITLPALQIKLYDHNGSPTGVRNFPSQHQPTTDLQSEPTSRDLPVPNPTVYGNYQFSTPNGQLGASQVMVLTPTDTSTTRLQNAASPSLQPNLPSPVPQYSTNTSPPITLPSPSDMDGTSLPTFYTSASTPLPSRDHVVSTPQRVVATVPSRCLTMNTTDESNAVSPSCPDDEDDDLYGIFPNEDREKGGEEIETIINTTEDEPELVQELDQNSAQLQSSNSKRIATVIGVSDLLIRFDRLRAQMKKQRNPSTRSIEEHRTLLSHIGQQILQSRTSTLMEIKALEQEFFTKHDRLPIPSETPEYRNLTTKYHNAVHLLRKLKIDL